MFRLILLVALSAFLPAMAVAQTCDTHTGLPVPRFVSLKFSNVNGRNGPSEEQSIVWNYVREGLPVEIIAETADWRMVRDPSGEETWMHRRTLIGTRTVITQAELMLYNQRDEDSIPQARAEAGAILQLEDCREGWCELSSGRLKGWTRGEALWGIYEEERSGMSGLIDTASLCISANQEPSG